MSDPTKPLLAVRAAGVPPRTGARHLPEPFASRLSGRVKHPLGDVFGLKAFGVNLTRLAAGDVSSLHHRHSAQDELVYVVEGSPTLVTDQGEMELSPGMCAGFPAGGPAHHLENRTAREVIVLEVGDRAGGGQSDLLCRGSRARVRPRRTAALHAQGRDSVLTWRPPVRRVPSIRGR